MAKDRTATRHPEHAPSRGSLGTYVAYGKDGVEIWRREDFAMGMDQVPTGISITMGAGVIVDPKTGERLHAWDPWDVLASV